MHGGFLDFRDPLHPYFGSFFIDLHVLLDLGEGRVYYLKKRGLKENKVFLKVRLR